MNAASAARASSVCASKLSFDTRDKAQKFAARIRQRGMAAQRAYHCPVCHEFHLSTKRTPIDITSPAGDVVGRSAVVDAVARCLESCEQTMAFDDRDGVGRVVVNLPAEAWRELVAMVAPRVADVQVGGEEE